MRVSPLAAVSTVGRNVDAHALGREANVRFIVEGTVHRAAPDNLEFTLRLTDTLDGRQLDAARVGATPGQAESDTSRRLVAAARQMLTGAVARVVRASGEQAASAQDLLDLALAVPLQDAVANAREVRRLASAAIQRDPHLAGAWAARAEAGTMLYFTDFTADGKALQAEIDADSYRAVTLDPGDVDAWIARANALRVQGNLDGGFAALDRAEQAQPSRYFPRFVRAWLLLDAGKPQEALSIVSDLRRALGPDAGSSLQACNAHLMLGSYEAAIAECERVISWDIWQVHASLAAAHAMLGHDEKANEARRRLVQAAPGFTLARYVSRFHPALAAGARDQEVAHLLPGLRKAGVPE
jgi:tetratricopeptide (TPR) repeat protein